MTNPFQAPDYGEEEDDETYLLEDDAQDAASGARGFRFRKGTLRDVDCNLAGCAFSASGFLSTDTAGALPSLCFFPAGGLTTASSPPGSVTLTATG